MACNLCWGGLFFVLVCQFSCVVLIRVLCRFCVFNSLIVSWLICWVVMFGQLFVKVEKRVKNNHKV